MRTHRCLSQDQLAKELYTTRSAIEAWERQRNRPGAETMRQYDEYFETDQHFQVIRFHGQREHLKEWLEEYLALEREATCIKVFQPMSIPGLLQTEGYIRAAAGKVRDIEEVVAQRLPRGEILGGENPPLLWAVLDEAAIRRPVGGAVVMKEQLQHLLDMGDRPEIIIQVVRESVGSYLGMVGSILLLTQPDGHNVGFVEAQFGGRLIQDRTEVTRLGIRYDQIRSKAMSEDDSRALIVETMEAMK